MNYLLLVSIMNGLTDCSEKLQSLGNTQLVRIAITIKRLALNIFHDEVGQAVLSSTPVEQQRNVWMIQRGENLALFAKASQNKVGIHPPLDQLDGYPLMEFLIDTYGFVDSAHAATSNLTLDAVSTEPPADHRIDFFGGKRLERMHSCLAV